MPRIHNEERIVSSINGAQKTGHLHTKGWNCTLILHYTQKSAQNGLKT